MGGNSLQRLLKIAGGTVVVIFLGAVGSGLWEKVLSPGLSRLSKLTASLISSFSSSFEESIYHRATKDATDLYPMMSVALILALAGFAFIMFIGQRELTLMSLPEKARRRINIMFTLQNMSLGIACAAVGFISLVRLGAALDIKQTSLRSLEILRPALGEQTYIQLRSDYYSIESKSDYELFKEMVLDHAESAAKRIPLDRSQ